MATRAGDQVMGWLARLLVRAFFGHIDVEGAERLPTDQPVLLVANHVNGLVDGLVLMAVLPRYPRFLGKATLFKILPLVPFLRLAGVVPVHRSEDAPANDTGAEAGRADARRNDAAFVTSRALLSERGLVALFPEGISHDEAQLQTLRTGAARIALGAAVDDGVADVVTVAVGLIYDDKARFRSRALVRIGEARRVDRWTDSYQRDPVAAVRALTDDLARQLASVAPMYGSRQDELGFRRVAALLANDAVRQDDIARALSSAAAGGPAAAARVAGLTDAVGRYEADLALVGLTDADVADGLSPGRYRRGIGGSVAVAVVSAPLAAFGTGLHAVPYGIMKQVGKLPPNEGMRATVKLLGCFTLFTSLYTVLGVVVGRRRGALAGLAAFALGPISGYAAVRWAERVQRLGGVARARAAMKERRDLVAGLASQREAVTASAHALLGDGPRQSQPLPAAR